MTLDETIDFLSQVPLLELIDREALRLMAFAAETRRLRPGEFLFRQGERSDGGFVVISGSLATRKDGSGEEIVAEPGALIGRTALFLRLSRPVSAVARERSEVLRISLTLMKRMLEEFPDAAVAIREAVENDLDALVADLERARQLLTADGPGETAARPASTQEGSSR